jgi:manganese/zinc/iron transport system permease protein
VLLTFINKRSDGNQAGLDHFLFGQAATLIAENVITMAVLGALALLAVSVFHKEFKLLSFDSGFAGSIGLPLTALNIGLTGLTVIAVVIGLQTVGVVLMAAMLVGPAVAARQWTHKLGTMLAIAALIGALSGVSGAVLSARDSGIPTGPMIILSLTVLVLISLFFAPERGLVWEWVRQRRTTLQEPV